VFTTRGGWGILLRSLPGDPSVEEINEVRAAAQRSLGRSDIRVIRRKSGVAIVLGSYDSPGDPRARRDMELVGSTVVGGQRVFARAMLIPPPRMIDHGKLPQFNLASVKARLGRQAIWTYQIGVYESPNRAEAKDAAERAVVELRKDGEQAFYYHGQTRSMITIGVFGRDDYDEQSGPKSPVLFGLTKKYPLNLLNGQFPIIERRPGQEPREQRSTLVRIPD